MMSTLIAIFLLLGFLQLLCCGKEFPNSLDSKPLYYIYEWPPELDDVYPPANATLHKSSSYDHAFRENGGAGRLLVPEYGLFQTWQFSLYKNVLSRLSVSPYRTR